MWAWQCGPHVGRDEKSRDIVPLKRIGDNQDTGSGDGSNSLLVLCRRCQNNMLIYFFFLLLFLSCFVLFETVSLFITLAVPELTP